MAIEKSKLAVNFPHIPNISGVEIFTCCTGMRYKKEDLFIAYFPKLANAAGVFTKSSMYGEPIAWCKSILDQHEAKILAVNSGYANVFCGEVGKKTIENTVAKLTEKFSCNPNQIYISSTGVIGEPVKDEFLLDAIDNKLEESSWLKATEAIGTTDTFPKGAYIESQINGVKVKLAGIIKGSGMVAPDMATMLSFIFTDAKISKQVLQELLEESIAGSYHSITVDSDTSTSDMVLAFATNHAENKVVEDINDPDFQQFRADFHELNKFL